MKTQRIIIASLIISLLAVLPAWGIGGTGLSQGHGGFTAGRGYYVTYNSRGILETPEIPQTEAIAVSLFSDYSRSGDYNKWPGTETTDWQIPLSLNWSYNEDWSFGFTVPFRKLSFARDSLGIQQSDESGIGDLSVMAKYQFFRSGNHRTMAALMMEGRFGTADDKQNLALGDLALGLGRNELAGSLLISHRLAARPITFNLNMGGRFVDEDRDFVTYGLGADYQYSSRVIFSANLAGRSGADDYLQIGPGITYQLTDNISLQTHAAWGMTDASPEFRVINGVTYLWDLHKNMAPVALIDATPVDRTNYQFSGARSYDLDGEIIGYAWDFGGGESGSGMEPQHRFPGPGRYVVRLTVTDDEGATGSVTQAVTIENVPPTAVIVPELLNQTLMNASYRLDGSRSSDVDGRIVKYEWEVAGQSLEGVSVEWLAEQEGALPVTLTVTDDYGAKDSAETTLDVKFLVNQPPTAVIRSSEKSRRVGQSIMTFNGAESSDPDGEVVEYRWVIDGQQLTGPVVDMAFTENKTVSVQLTVVDNLGATGSAEATVPVTVLQNQPPTAVITPDERSRSSEGAVYVLDGSQSSDPDGTVEEWHWTIDGQNLEGEEIRFTFLNDGDYAVTLRVVDNMGGEGSTAVTIPIILPEIPHTIIPEDRRIIVSSIVLFDFDRANLRPDAIEALRPIGHILQEYPYVSIVVEGHTCNLGREAYNQGLSERRAKAVYDYLITEMGIEASRLQWIGYGEMRPRYSNDAEETRSLNRRVEFKIEGDTE